MELEGAALTAHAREVEEQRRQRQEASLLQRQGLAIGERQASSFLASCGRSGGAPADGDGGTSSFVPQYELWSTLASL